MKDVLCHCVRMWRILANPVTHTCTHAHTHARMHAHTHVHTHAHTHAHTYILHNIRTHLSLHPPFNYNISLSGGLIVVPVLDRVTIRLFQPLKVDSCWGLMVNSPSGIMVKCWQLRSTDLELVCTTQDRGGSAGFTMVSFCCSESVFTHTYSSFKIGGKAVTLIVMYLLLTLDFLLFLLEGLQVRPLWNQLWFWLEYISLSVICLSHQ